MIESIFKKQQRIGTTDFFRTANIEEIKCRFVLWLEDKSVFLKNEYLKCVPTWEKLASNAGPDSKSFGEWMNLVHEKNNRETIRQNLVVFYRAKWKEFLIEQTPYKINPLNHDDEPMIMSLIRS